MRLYHELKGIAIDIDVLGGDPGRSQMHASATLASTGGVYYLPQFLGWTKEEVLIKVVHWAGTEGFELSRPTAFGKERRRKGNAR